ncbi:MAG: multicopper oxidase domain-containing protein, partial [Candidatus Tectomicrobia bacterium]|nr:multicopper oxidase domain-containing protein [Candidatus Tectomicrobia bacterium]
FVYEFVAYPAGTHIYYGHANTNEPMNKGLYGPLIILPKQAGSDLPEEWAKINRDVVLMLDEWNSAFFKGEEAKSAMAGQQTSKRMAGYNFTINGNVFTDERPTMLSVKRGERIRVRLINMGELSHTMYLPGHSLLITHIDGYSAPAPQRLDTVSITPGQRIDLVFEANQEGRWIWQCHTASHAMSDDGHRRGMLLMVAYPDGLDLAKFPLSKPTKLSE